MTAAPRIAARRPSARDPHAPSIARAAAPPLPSREHWPPVWFEVHRERWCIAAEGGARDPGAVADLDLRVAVHRGELPPSW